MEFITTGNRIAVENFDIGKIYTITWQTGNHKSLACTGKGTDFVMFQDQEPDLLFCLTMDSAISVSSIEEGGGGSGTNNYNELENKPSINGFVLVGNKTGADLGLASQSDLEDYATNASVVAGLATKQDALSSSQLAAVNSGITSALVTQIGTNTSAIAGKQDALSSSQLAAVNSGITSALVTQIGTNTSAIAGKQDALSSSQLQAVNSGITSELVTQIGTNTSAIAGKQDALSSSQLSAVNSGITSSLVTQIRTNENNISSSYSNGYLQSYNLYPYGTLTGTGSLKTVNLSLPAGTYKISWKADRNDKSTVMTFKNGGTTVAQDGFTNSTSKQIKTVTLSTAVDSVEVYSNDTVTLSDIMIIDGTMADSTPFRAYTMSNAEITAWIQAHT